MSSIGENIRSARLRAGFKLAKDFAAALQEEAPRLSDWEGNRFDTLKLPTLIKIAKTARCGIDDLVAGLDPEYDATRRDLTRPSSDQQSGASLAGGSPTDEQRAEVPTAVEREVDKLYTALAYIETTAESIVTAVRAARGEEGARTAPTKPRRRRPRRASG